MIPKKVSLYRKARAKISILKLKRDKERLRPIAKKNSEKKQKPSLQDRTMLAKDIKTARFFDRKNYWSVSFRANLKKTNIALGVNLENVIKTLPKNARVLEIGAGSGRAISELQKLFPEAKFSASGVALSNEWMHNKNYKKIDWKVMHANQIKKYFKPSSLDLIYSSLGLTRVLFGNMPKSAKLQSLLDVKSVLKKGGLLIFNSPPSKLNSLREIIAEAGLEIVESKLTRAQRDTKIEDSRTSNYYSFVLRKVD